MYKHMQIVATYYSIFQGCTQNELHWRVELLKYEIILL